MPAVAEVEAEVILNGFGVPVSSDEPLAGPPLTEEEVGAKFDELSQMAVNQPDDEVAFNSLRRLVTEARDRGQINMARQMAVTLGAMACLHPHLESFASEIGSSLDGAHNDHPDEPGHTHAAEEKDDDKKEKSKRRSRATKEPRKRAGRRPSWLDRLWESVAEARKAKNKTTAAAPVVLNIK